MRLAILAAAVLALSGPASAQAPAARPMERVDGIGGFFFRAKDPKALAQWYADNLGVGETPGVGGGQPWRQSAGPTAFQAFPATTRYFGRPEQAFMLNFRVKDLDAMVAQLRRAGAVVEVDPQSYPYGRFALTHDPEGNPIQLWQPIRPKP